MTPFDRARATGDDARALDALASSELRLILAEEPAGDALKPLLLELDGAPTALAFDTDARLADFLDAPAATATLPGRAAIALLAGTGVRLGVNLGVADSAMLLPAEALAWAADAFAAPVSAVAGTPDDVGPPPPLPEGLAEALEAKIAALGGVVAEAWLASTGGRLVVAARTPGGRDSRLAEGIARAFSDTLRLAAPDLDAAVSVVADAAALAGIRASGRAIPVPTPPPLAAPRPPSVGPGMDPDRPPRLR